MQITLELPERLANRIRGNEDLAALIQLGLRVEGWPESSSIASEVIDFLATGPDARKLIDFHPSESIVARMRELLIAERNGQLTAAGRAELDEMGSFDNFISLLKARAWEYANSSS